MYAIIRKTILEREKPFVMSDLFHELKQKDITDKNAILKVLDELLNIGLVECSNSNNGIDISYQSIFAIA